MNAWPEDLIDCSKVNFWMMESNDYCELNMPNYTDALKSRSDI